MYLNHLYKKVEPIEKFTYTDLQCAAMECAETVFKSNAEIIKYEAQAVFANEAGEFFNKVKEVASKIWEAIKKFLKVIKNFFVGVFRKIKSFFAKSETTLASAAKEEEKIVKAATPEQISEVKQEVTQAAQELTEKVNAEVANASPEKASSSSSPAIPQFVDEKSAIEAIEAILKEKDKLSATFMKLQSMHSDDGAANITISTKESLDAFLSTKKTEEARKAAAEHIVENLNIIAKNEQPVRESVKVLQKHRAICDNISERFEKAISDIEKAIATAEGYMSKAKQGSIVYNQMAKAAQEFRDILNKIKEQATAYSKTAVRTTEYIKQMANLCQKAQHKIASHDKEFTKAEKKYGKV